MKNSLYHKVDLAALTSKHWVLLLSSEINKYNAISQVPQVCCSDFDILNLALLNILC